MTGTFELQLPSRTFGLNSPTVWTLRSTLARTGPLQCLGHHLFVTTHPKYRNDPTGAER